MRHAVSLTRSEVKNSSADSKAFTPKRTDLIRLLSASRIDASSSTIEMWRDGVFFFNFSGIFLWGVFFWFFLWGVERMGSIFVLWEGASWFCGGRVLFFLGGVLCFWLFF